MQLEKIINRTIRLNQNVSNYLLNLAEFSLKVGISGSSAISTYTKELVHKNYLENLYLKLQNEIKKWFETNFMVKIMKLIFVVKIMELNFRMQIFDSNLCNGCNISPFENKKFYSNTSLILLLN